MAQMSYSTWHVKTSCCS